MSSYNKNIKMNIITLNTQDKITSIDLTAQINYFRGLDGKKELEHKNLLSVIRDEFEEEFNRLNF